MHLLVCFDIVKEKKEHEDMEIQVLGSTKPQYTIKKEEAILFSGRSAGICYMPDTIEVLFSEAEEKSKKRAQNTLQSGHHSVFDHVTYHFSLSNIPKILAILLNNEGMYTTSEKSARYTKMQTSPQEQKIYEKWIGILQEEIQQAYPTIKEKQVLKLAQENARYFISVFTPATSMEYTVSLRQLNYILRFFENYIQKEEDTSFSKKLKPILQEFLEKMKPFQIEGLNADFKKRELSLFAKRKYGEEFGECYCTTYQGTFAQYAQAQRHRTLRYKLCIPKEAQYYVPIILQGKENLVSKWEKDMKSLEDQYPQGMLIDIVERGTVDDFILKCKERLCGSAQLEIMLQTKETLDKYLENTQHTNQAVYEYLQPYASGVRCKFPDFTCTSPCIWGPNKALTRKI